MSDKPKRKRVYKDYLNDINVSIEEIQEFTSNMSYKDFFLDRKTSHAVVRCFEIIGEAVKNLPVEIKSKYPEVPWREIAGMRDKMAHEYFGIDLKIVWQTIGEDLPSFKSSIKELIDEEE
ncbi:MAG: DUF86 domain-containing protein [Candidatus Aminicenantes bacterium]|nr:DUF86 domain-containing protein [Candidatus Aminicenantes bacterium]